jgi:large subunit ribosomal protein L18
MKNTRIYRLARHKRLRVRVIGTNDRPRLCVFRSSKNIYAQIIDDSISQTLATASSLDKEIKEAGVGEKKTSLSKLVGSLIAKRAGEKGISKVVFDRGGYKYHGRIKSLADSAREEGLLF